MATWGTGTQAVSAVQVEAVVEVVAPAAASAGTHSEALSSCTAMHRAVGTGTGKGIRVYQLARGWLWLGLGIRFRWRLGDLDVLDDPSSLAPQLAGQLVGVEWA